jgi:hypothetical protein
MAGPVKLRYPWKWRIVDLASRDLDREIWDRWQAGESMSSIGRRFDRESSSVFSVISPTGGIRPPARHRTKQAAQAF